MRKIKLMPDYECPPIWIKTIEDDIFLPVNVEDVDTIQEDLKVEILEWDTLFQNTYDREDGRNSGFSTNEDLDSFEKKGIEIWEKLIKRLPQDSIYYFSVKYYELYEKLKDYPAHPML